MKINGSPRTARKFSQRARIITAITTFSLLLLMLGVPAFMQSLQKGDAPDTAPSEKFNLKGQKPQRKSKADLEAAGLRAEQDIVVEPSATTVASNYTFTTATNATLTDMSTGTTTIVAADQDDTASTVMVLPMDFYFQGVRYSSFSANSNGLLRLGVTAVQGSTPYKPLAQASIPLLTAYGADQRTLASTGKVHTKIIGTAPNRVLVVEWLNMQSNFNAAGTSDLTYQARLYETTGVIEYVYGKATMSTLGAADANSKDPHIGFSSSNTAGTVGSVTAAQSGTPAPTFNGASATPVANTYTAGAIPVLNTTTEGSRRIFTFTPPVPNAPTNLTFSSVTPSSYTVNWTDSSNETLYAIYRSTDGVNYTFQNTAAQNATSFAASGLTPSTTYFWQVYAVSEGALSTALSGSQATSAPGNITSTPVGGNWSATTTWVGGVVPTATDNVTIADGATVTIDATATANAFSLSVGTGLVAPTTLIYNATAARTLTVATSVTITSNGVIQSAATGTITTHVLSVGTNLTNNGVLDFSTNTNTAGANITFTGAANNTFGGTGATTDVLTITINKGTSNANVLELNPSVFTVRGATTDSTSAAYLTLTNGTFKISGTFTAAFRTFTAASYTIPATTGFWLNNPNYTVSGQNGSPSTSGLLRLSQGTYNVGTSSGNTMDGAAGAVFIIEGGTLNASGRFGPQNAVSYTQTAGTVNVNTVGNSGQNFGSFELFSTSSSFTMSGGTINLVQACTNATTPVDYQVLSSSVNITGGTLNVGTAATATNFNFRIRGNVPNMVIDNTTNNKTATVTAQTVIFGNTTVSPGTTLNLGGFLVAQIGATLVNNGTILGNTTSSRLYFAGSVPQTYSGSGVAGTVALPLQSVDFDSTGGVTFSPSTTNNLITNRIILFTGNVTNASKLTLGVGGSSTATVQVGNTTTPTNAGSLDVAPTFNLGTGGEVISYLRTTNARTTGAEINPTRTLTSMTYDDNDSTHALTIAGGDLTLSGTGAALTLTTGRVLTGSNTLALSSGTATVTRTAGYVDGNFRKNITATGTKAFEVGTANGYSPLSANVTAGTGNMTVKATQGKAPYISGTNALGRFWTLTGTGLTANLTYTYLASDVTGTVANYKFIKNSSGTLSTLAPTGTPTSTSAVINGVSSFSDWTLAEAGAVQSGTIEFSGVPASVNEGAGNLSVSVFRTGGSDGAVSVQYTTTDGTATGGADYTTQTGTLNWASGDATAKTISVPINDDNIYEDNETFTITLSNPAGGATLGTAVKNVSISDNDTAPLFSINDVSMAEGEAGPVRFGGETSFVFTVTRTGATQLPASVNFQTFDASATTADGDYQANSGTLNFAATDTTKTVTVTVNHDAKYENNEVFNVKLSNASGASISDDTGDGNIENDDNKPSFSIDNVTHAEGNSGTTAYVFTITKNGETALASSVQAATVDGTATLADGDYQSNTGTFNFDAADATKQFTVLVNGDTTSESDETFTVQLSSPGEATIFDDMGTGTITNDDAANTNPTISDIADQSVSQDNSVTAAFTVGDAETSAASLTLTGSSSDQTLLPDANITFGGTGANRTVTVTPAAGQVGSANVTITVTDESNGTASDQFVLQITTATCMQPPAGLYGWWTGQGNPLDIWGAHNGTATGGVSYAAAKVGQGFVFNGTINSHVNIADSSGDLNAQQLLGFTADFWMKGSPTQGFPSVTVVEKTRNGGGWGFDADAASGKLLFSIGNTSITSDAVVLDDRFHHVAGTFGTDGTLRLYIDGVLQSQTATNTTPSANTGSVNIGYRAASVTDFYTGTVDELEIFQGALTGAQALALYNASSAGKCHANTVQFVDNAYSVSEAGGEGGDPFMTISVERTGAHDAAASVSYATVAGGTATDGADYTGVTGTLTFAAGQTFKTFDIPILQDNFYEGDETVNLELSNASGTGTALGTQTTAVLTINDDEAVPSLSIDDVTHMEGNSSTTAYAFTVTKTGATTQTVTVDYNTADGTATAPSDYTGIPITQLSFAPNETTKQITVQANGDTDVELNEIFTVHLSNASGATIADADGMGTIENDDVANTNPTISDIADQSVSQDNSVTAFFTVGDAETSAASLTLTGSSSDQTLLPDANITFGGTGANRTVTVTPAAGQTGTATVTVTVHDTDSGTASDSFVLTVNPVTCYAPPSGMVSWYSAENNASDIYGSNNGTELNGAAYAPGKVGQAFSFDGTDDYVETTDFMDLSNPGDEITIDAWIKRDATTPDAMSIATKWDNNTETGWFFRVSNDRLNWGTSVAGIYHQWTSDATFTDTSNFHHVAITLTAGDGSSLRVYLDGVQMAGSFIAGDGSQVPGNTPWKVLIGALQSGGGHIMDGKIDEVEFFNRALTSTEIAGIYNASSAGKCHTSTLQFSSASYNANENGNPPPITVTRTGAHDSAASVDYATTDGTATGNASCGAGVDYETSTGTLSFAAGEVSKTFSVPVCDDAVFEGDETLNLALSNQTGTGVTLGTPNTGVLTINDDEGQPSLSVNDFTFTGADSRAVDGFTVTLSGASAQTVTVHYATSDDTAHAGEDYTATSGTLTFAPGDTTKTIPVTILADNVNEPTETFSVDLDMPVNATVSDGHGVGTIPNDDPQPTISIDDVTFTGADSRVASGFTVTLSNPSSSTITVHYATSNDTAIAGEDYTAASGTLTFDPGDTSKSITVTILADNVNEPTETFNVDLDTPTNATILDGHGVGTIPNDDAQPTLSIDDVTHSEGDSGTTSYTFTVTKTGATSLTVTVDFATADGTATTANGDYQTNTGSLTFLPGDTTKTVTVLAVGNTIYETDETFNVNLSNATNASISDGQGQGTITNDDAKPTLSITSAVTLTEGNSGTKNFNFTVTKSGATDLDATVSYATADGTATGNASCGAGVDYASKSGTLTFHPADLTMTVTVPVCGDTVYEVNETFNVNLSSPTDATITNAQGTGTINNDDKPPTTLVVNTTDDLNSGFCFPAHCSLREAIVAANFNSDSNTITFQIPAGDPGHFYYADDNTAGQLSRANVTATSASDDTTISDIDPDWPHSWWTISPQSALPSTTATLTIDGYSQAGAVANTSAAGDNAVLRVEVNGTGAGLSVNGVAVGGSSSTLKGLIVNRFGGSGVSLSGGLHSVSGNFIGTDTSGTIALANVVAGVTTNGFSNQIGGTTPAARNLISGNTGDGISFASGNSYLVQGNLVGTKSDGTTALGNGANGITFSGGGAVFNTVGGVNTGEANTIAFNGGDGVYLDATAGGSNNVRGNSVYSNGTTSAHLGIDLGADGVTSNDLQDADTGPNSLQNFPVISSVTVTGSTKTITGTLNSKPNQEFTIDFYSNPSCDASGNGEGKTYIGSLLTGMTDANGDVSFTFHPSALSVGQSITATATDSGGNTSEFSQCVAVAGGIPGTIEFTSATYSVDENDGIAVITVKRTGGSQGSISATFDTSDGTATAGSDYTAVNSYTVTFADGDTTNKTINIPVTDNMVYEGNETVNLSLSSTSVNKVSGGANPLAAVLTITENDAPPTLSIDDVTFTGADSRVGQSFTVTLTGATDLPVTVHYATNDGTAHAGEDYTSATGTLTFNPGVTTQPIPVAIVADNRDEPTETFSVDLDTPVGATISDAQGVGTIPNDDAEPTLSVDDFTFTGADSRSVNGFTVNLSAPSSFTITVHYATSDGTAIAGEDYTAASGTLTFNPGDTTKIIPVTILGDTTNEPSEAFNVDLDTPTHATISDGHAVGTIPNDDAQPSMAIANATKVEGDSGSSNVTFTVTLSNPSTQTVSAQFTTTDGTASSGSDYSATTGTITFNPNQTSKTITVVVAGDIKDEANENFSVVLSNPSNASISTGTGVCTIIDDDLNTGDFDGDGKNDLAVFRPAADNTPNSKWYILNSADGTVVEKPFGTETDIPVAADYDGDGRKEIAVFRPSEGAWYIWRDASQDFVSVVWGLDGDKPVPGDYDGDGKADVAVFRPSDGYWYIRRSTDDQLQAQPWGLSTDKPVPADYDGDGKTDLAVFRKDDPAPGSGTWYILNTSDGTFSVAQWGFNTDKLVPADYDLDGKADIAIWRPSDGTFYVRNSSDGGLATAQWGLTGDVPVVGDYDGDGKADYAVFRPSSGHHFIKLSSDGTYIGPIWGAGTDVPVPSRYVPEQ